MFSRPSSIQFSQTLLDLFHSYVTEDGILIDIFTLEDKKARLPSFNKDLNAIIHYLHEFISWEPNASFDDFTDVAFQCLPHDIDQELYVTYCLNTNELKQELIYDHSHRIELVDIYGNVKVTPWEKII